MVSYGNRDVQNNFMESYKASLSNQTAGQNFLQGVKKIISMGKRSFMSKNRDTLLEMTYLFNCMFIQNICEGQNKTMKDFLREQQYIKVDVDIVSILAKSCESMATKIVTQIPLVDNKIVEALGVSHIANTEEYLSFLDWSKTEFLPDVYDFLKLKQVLKTMTELSQGPCLANQSTFIQSNVVNSLCKLLQRIGCYFYQGLISLQKFKGDRIEDMKIIASTIEGRLPTEAAHITNSLAAILARKVRGNPQDAQIKLVKTQQKYIYIYIYIYI